jgi:glutaredoxin
VTSKFFNTTNCVSCGAKIISDLSRCPYCDRELNFVWKLNSEQETELIHLINKLELRMLEFFGSSMSARIPQIRIYFTKNKKKFPVNLSLDYSMINLGRSIKYLGIFLFYFFCFAILPLTLAYFLNKVLLLVPLAIISASFSYVITYVHIQKKFYSREEMIQFSKSEILPEIKLVLNRMGIGWTDFDQFLLSKYFTADHNSFSSIASLVYLNDRK